MTEEQARSLCQQRRMEQPDAKWVAQQRGDGEWVVARLPSLGRIAPGSLTAEAGPDVDVHDDPRPSNIRNIPPFGAGA